MANYSVNEEKLARFAKVIGIRQELLFLNFFPNRNRALLAIFTRCCLLQKQLSLSIWQS